MEKKDLLQLLDNVVEGGETESLNKHDRVLLIDGLNLFFRNFAMLKFINGEGIHVGGLGGFLRSLGFLINHINRTSSMKILKQHLNMKGQEPVTISA